MRGSSMNRHEALAEALHAIAGGKLTEGQEILQSNFLRAHRTAANDLLDIQERTKIYEANSYRDEPWPEYLAVLLLSVIGGLDKRGKAIVDCCQAILDSALDVAMEENCGVDVIADMAVAGLEPTDHRFIVTCICVAKHHLEWKAPSAARKWFDLMEHSKLDGIFLKTVDNIKEQCQDEESEITKAAGGVGH
jgi:hypothetical protein